MGSSGSQVIVHLGALPDYTYRNLELAALHLPNFETILVVDSRLNRTPTNVTVMQLDDLVTRQQVNKIRIALKQQGIDPNWRKGYWTQVFLRFLVLKELARQLDPAIPMVQIESDVISFLTPELIERLNVWVGDLCGMPFIDAETAGPGLMFAKHPAAMAKVCQFVLDRLESGLEVSDMKSLARAVQEGLVSELPSLPRDSGLRINVQVGQQAEKATVLFDAAAVGQFLFGIDPRNNNGILVPGYRERRGDIDPGLWRNWAILQCGDGIERISCEVEDNRVVFGNLHIHSKQVLPPVSSLDPVWLQTVRIANGLQGFRPEIDIRYLAKTWLKRLLP